MKNALRFLLFGDLRVAAISRGCVSAAGCLGYLLKAESHYAVHMTEPTAHKKHPMGSRPLRKARMWTSALRVFGDVTIPLRLAKQRLDRPQVVVCGCRRGVLRHLIPEFHERRPRNRGEVEIRCGSQESNLFVLFRENASVAGDTSGCFVLSQFSVSPSDAPISTESAINLFAAS